MTSYVAPPSDPLRQSTTANSKIVLPRLIRLSAMALALAGVAAFGVIVYSAYQSPKAPEDVPLITADNSPLREKPAEAGGMEVANRDSTIYSQLDDKSQRSVGGLERLVPPPEQPVAGPALNPAVPGTMADPRRPDGSPALTSDEIRALQQQRHALRGQGGDAGEVAVQQLSSAATNLPPGAAQGHLSTVPTERLEPAAPAQKIASAPVVTNNTASPLEEDQVAAQAATSPIPEVSAAPTAAAPVVQSAPVVLAPQETKREAVKAPAPAPVAAARPVTGSATRMVQLGAVRTEEAAKAEWRRLQTKFRNQLGNLTVNVQKADLGARGIYWRIQGGPVSEAESKSICDALKAAAQSCISVAK